MKVITESELTSRLDFMRPLHPPPEEPASAWCIPFEYGANEKGTRISVPKALQIIAELRAEVAEANLRDMRKYFDEEKARGDRLVSEYSKASDESMMLREEIAILKRKLRAKAKRRKSGNERVGVE